MEADDVTVVVHGARGLQGKKPGRHKYSVIFGVGSKKYRTSVVRDEEGCPDWNEESIIHVNNNSDHVFFTMTEKDEILGQIVIPVASLLTVKGVVKKSPLKPHKKCPTPKGELIFQCYVSKQRPTMITPQIRSGSYISGPQLTGFQRLRQNFNTSSPMYPNKKKEEKEEKRKSSSLANFNKKLSKSIHDIFHLGKISGDNEQEEDKMNNKSKRFSLRFPSLGSGLDSSGREIPVVTHIVPNMATIHGGTRLVLEGRNLGLGKSDIVELLLCDSDLLDSIEFESENRIYVTTKANTAGKGDLWIETVSGGQNVLKNVFTFVDRSTSTTPTTEKKQPVVDSGSISSRGKNTALAESLAEATIPEDKMAPASAENNNLNISIPVERSNSLTENDPPKPSSPRRISSTMPRTHSSSSADNATSNVLDSPSSRFRKNYQKHKRGASETIVAISRDAEARKTGVLVIEFGRDTVTANILDMGKGQGAEKADFQTEILRLHKENEVLKQENADMKKYIDGLVARVMIHCPEALAAGDDLKPLSPRS